ncbi:MAG: AMP-binding protein [Haloarculaceae archaeon]
MTLDPGNPPRLDDEHVARYTEAGDWGEETLIEVVEPVLKANPEKRIVGPRRTRTFAELWDDVRRVSVGLQELGIGAGDVVSYQLPNWTTTNVLHLAAARVGAVCNPIIPIYRESEVGYILQDAGTDLLVVPNRYDGFDYPSMVSELVGDCPALDHVVVVGSEEREVHDSVETTPFYELRKADPGGFVEPSLDPNDVHALLYTSGTTADPKGVLHTYNTLLCEQYNTIDLLALSTETTIFMPSPVTHVTGMLYALEMPFVEGMDLVLMADWDADRAVELVDRYDCNVTVGATPFLRGIYESAPDDWQNPLRVFGCGGADIPPELVRDATEKLGCTVQRIYGSTEFPTATWPPLDAPIEKLATTDGPAAPGAHLKVVDIETGEERPRGERGELWGHSPELMVGYLGDDLNDDAFEGEWFETGDLAVMDEEGYIEITGRKKDIIIRGGENIPVKDVEDRLFEHPAVEEVAVVAMPDPEMQEKGCAYVKVREGHEFTFEDMIDYLDEQGIAKQKYPERLELVEAFPMTASGKIQKNELREDIAKKLGREPVQRD